MGASININSESTKQFVEYVPVSVENNSQVRERSFFPLVNITNNADGKKEIDRFLFQKLRYITQKISEETRVCNCGRVARHGTELEVWSDGSKKSYYKNLFQCGSVWVCPHCRFKIMTERRAEIVRACKAAQKSGLFMGFLGLTSKHEMYKDGVTLKEQISSINKVWRYLMGIPSLRKMMNGAGFEYIKSFDTRYNKTNGFHPHFHIIIFARTREDAEMICNLIIDYWLSKFPGTRPEYQSYDPVFDNFDEKLQKYMTKSGLSDEMTDPCLNKKSKDSINPLDVLRILHERNFTEYSEAECVRIYREYARAIKGLRSITWSKGLKKRFGIKEVTDETIIHNDENLKRCELKISAGVFEVLQVNKAVHLLLKTVDRCLEDGNLLLMSELRKNVFDPLNVQVAYRETNKLFLANPEYEYTGFN